MREKDRPEDSLLMNLRRILLEELSEDFPMAPAEAITKAADHFTVRVCDEFGGSCAYFPIALPDRFARRNAEILAAFSSGASYSQLAKSYRLTERRIRALVEKGRKDEGQRRIKKAATDRPAE